MGERDCPVARLGFVPSLGRSGKDQWIRLTVLALGKGTAPLQQEAPNGSTGVEHNSQNANDVTTLRVSQHRDYQVGKLRAHELDAAVCWLLEQRPAAWSYGQCVRQHCCQGDSLRPAGIEQAPWRCAALYVHSVNGT